MVIESYSFLKKIIGRNAYNAIKELAHKIIPIATCILIVLWVLSFFFHWRFISSLLNLTTGTSLIFIAYILCLIILFDKGIDVVLEENTSGYSSNTYSFPKEKPKGYKKTVIIGVILLLFGVASIYFTNIYRKMYAFECNTFLVDHQKGIYHLDCDNDCEVASEASDLEKMKGYQIDESYVFCDWCEEWAEDAEYEYNSNRYFRK